MRRAMLTRMRLGGALATGLTLTFQHRRRGFARACIAALALLALQGPSFAENGLAYDEPSPDRENRRAIARDLEATFAGLDKQVPTLSPTQEQWLQTEERDQTNSARSLAAMDSIEYNISVVKPRTQEVIATLERIRIGKFANKNEEVALWAQVCVWLSDHMYWQAVRMLGDKRVVREKIDGDDSLYFHNFTNTAHAILEKIVIPHLRGRLP